MVNQLVQRIKLMREMRKTLKWLKYKGNHKQAEILEQSIEVLKYSSKIYAISTKEER